MAYYICWFRDINEKPLNHIRVLRDQVYILGLFLVTRILAFPYVIIYHLIRVTELPRCNIHKTNIIRLDVRKVIC